MRLTKHPAAFDSIQSDTLLIYQGIVIQHCVRILESGSMKHLMDPFIRLYHGFTVCKGVMTPKEALCSNETIGQTWFKTIARGGTIKDLSEADCQGAKELDHEDEGWAILEPNYIRNANFCTPSMKLRL